VKPGWKALALLAACYYAGAKLGMLTVMPEGMAVLWLPNGVVLAALLAFRGQRMLAIAAVVVATEVAASVPRFAVGEAIAFGLINFGEAGMAYGLLILLRFDARFASVQDLWKFLVAAPLAAAGWSALLGAGIYTAFRGSETGYLQFMLTWWLGDALGLLMVTPFFLSFGPFGSAAGPVRFGRLDAAVWLALAAILGAAWLAPGGSFTMQFAVVPLIAAALFAAVRYPLRWSTFAVLCVGAFMVVALHEGHQPFGPLPPRLAVLRTQEFLFLVALLALGIGSMLHQLRAKNAELEAGVAARTAELEAANARLRTLAAVDELSGLANRRSFDAALASEAARTLRYGRPLSLIVADLDHFKRINDTHGHAAGDEVIRRIARVLADNARAADLVARYGGEEFAVLLPETGAREAFQLAERMRVAVAGLSVPPVPWPINASFGVATLQADGTPAALLSAADAALYEAKAAGRNQTVLSGKSRHSLPSDGPRE
jgi:diguanylate cyclase (GGDEF)-like protein